MNILKFMSSSPVLTFCILFITYCCIDGCVKSISNAGRCPDCKIKHEKKMEED